MNPKRRFFQIHLSTAVVLTLVAGVLLGSNFVERSNYWSSGADGKYNLISQKGFPFIAYSGASRRKPEGFVFSGLICNVLSYVLVLTAIVLLLERGIPGFRRTRTFRKLNVAYWYFIKR